MLRPLRDRPLVAVMAAYAVVGVALWPVPVFNVLHVESSAVVAAAAFFASGPAAIVLFRRGAGLGAVLGRLEAALAVPWLLLTVTVFWAPNCGYLDGLLFFLLFPVFSVGLAVALAYALAPDRTPYRWLVGIGLAVAVLGPVYDLGLHPQFYTYNHVFGGILGPIYDEELSVRPGLFAFRGLTLLWAALLVVIGWMRRHPRPWRLGVRLALLGVVLAIGGMYMASGPLGLNTPTWYLRQALGAVYRTTHFDIYYNPASLDADALHRIAADHEYHYARHAAALRVEVPERIASYLYPDADTKARLTGARYTNVAPVWLPEPQVHVLLPAYNQVFPHELAHVFSRAFGLPVLRASWSVGLVEGLAVALEPPDGRPTPHEQVAVAITERVGLGEAGAEIGLADALAARLSPLGFWSGRGAVSYTTMGSFVRYLLDAYGPEPFKVAYASLDFEAAYGQTVHELATAWEAYVMGLPAVARSTGALVNRRFAIPSLFEKPCPHYVPPYRRRYRRGIEALADGDTTQALRHLDASLAEQPAYTPALSVWARIRLAQGRSEAVIARLDTMAAARQVPALAVLLGDALVLQHRPPEAIEAYDAAQEVLPLYAHDEVLRVGLRKALADAPAVVRLLRSARAAGEQAAQLEARAAAEPVIGVVRILLLEEAGRYEQAYTLLRSMPVPRDLTPADRLRFRRQRDVWLAHLANRAGRVDAALAHAQEATRTFEAAGDFNMAAYLAAWHDQVHFKSRSQELEFRSQEGRYRE